MSWNVLYGFNHHKGISNSVAWIETQRADVIAFQELNGHSEEGLQSLAAQWGHPYAAIHRRDGFPVGLTSTEPIEVIERRVKGFHHGYLHAKTHGIHFFVVHFWPGQIHEPKHILELVEPHLKQGERVMILGDFNSNSRVDAEFLAKGIRTPEYEVVDLFEKAGFVDIIHKHDPKAAYSSPSPITIPRWSKNMEEVVAKRMRIDFIFADAKFAKLSRSGTVLTFELLDSLSDHYPVVSEFIDR